MALTAGNADAQTRPLPSAWTPLDNPHNMQEALEALEAYRKKDPGKNKGESAGTQQQHTQVSDTRRPSTT